MTAEADPIVVAVAGDLEEWEHLDGEPGEDYWQRVAGRAVQAHRRAILDRRGDGERWATLVELAERSQRGILAAEGASLLAALADETIARRQAEADAQRLREQVARVRELAQQAGPKHDQYEFAQAVLAALKQR